MRKTWTTPGGVHPPDNKRQSLGESIGSLPLPDRLILPLNQHIGAFARPLVAEGDKVLKGQMIAEPGGFISAAIHAPTSGTVESVIEHPVPHPSGMSADCVILAPDGEERWIEHHGVEDYLSASPSALLGLIRDAGITGLGGAGFPTEVKLGPRKPIETLIINGTECEPYITADHALMRERAADIVEGIRILAHLLGDPREILIGIEDNKEDAYDALLPHLDGTAIELVEFPTKYPSGGEKQLIQILTGREVPSGKLPIDLGIVCQNVGTTYAVYRAVRHGEPLISRITTVTGEALATNRNYEVLLGTPIRHLLVCNGFSEERCERLIMGGPMMGFTLQNPEVPVIKTTNCILAPDLREIPPDPMAQPCIRCGLCAEACPASLLPQQLYWYAQSQNHERLEAHSLFDCIECGACAYVCPSNIPLVQYYRAAKGEIRKLAEERKKSDHARQRFEFHKARQERLEAEKAAKREARRKAAEAAKETAATGAPKKGKGSADDIIAMAKARAAERKASPEQARAKLERGVESARDRLKAAEEKLAEAQREAIEGEALEKLRARVETARLKLGEAERKLQQEVKPAEVESAKDTGKTVAAKMQQSPREQLEKKIATLRERIAGTEAKIADIADATTVEAMRKGLDKQQQKLRDAERELAELPPDAQEPGEDPVAADAAAAAIARAQARIEARQSQTPEQQRQARIESLRQRIDKAEQKLARAEAEGSEHIDTLRTSVDKLRAKLDTEQREAGGIEENS